MLSKMAMESKPVATQGFGNGKLKMDAPFALCGYVAGTGSKYQMMDGSQRARTHTNRTFSAGTSQPCTALNGVRGLHSSRVLSDSSKVANRPLSPHLALKKPQLWATYSISHRILGGVLAGAIMLSPIAMKFSLLYDV